jgi:sigma-54 interacting transcriptional regulator/FHA domain-containing protein
MGRGRKREPPPVAVAQLVVALHCDRPSTPPSRHLLDGLDEVRFGRGDAKPKRDARAKRLTLTFSDPRMSSDHGRLVRDGDTWWLEDPSSKNGCIVNGTLTRRSVLGDGDLLELGHICLLFRVAPPVAGPPDLGADDLGQPANLQTFSGSLAEAFTKLARVAATDVPILVTGDTGTGKELVARAVHDLSKRTGPFVAVNCGALPETLLEAELFGARRGAFSGATVDRPGLVRSADGGTLFLDEIAELRAPSQAAFLRVIQEREVLALGDTRPIKVDVRFCSATHRHLDDMIEDGTFRRDLHARLAGYTIALPVLRARREDLGLVIRALLARRTGGTDASFTPAAARALHRYDWPNNVRELEQSLAAALALAADRAIDITDLGDAIQRGPRDEAAPSGDELHAKLVALLTEHHGNIAAVARAVGKDRMQVHRWVRRYAIDLEQFRRT